MFKHLYLIVVIWVLVISSVQSKSYIRDYTYKASDADSKITSRAIALDQVKTILLQEIGTHIRQNITIYKDSNGNEYSTEDIEAITAGLTRVMIMEEKWNGEEYYLKAKIDADTDRVLSAISEFKKSNDKKLQLLKYSRSIHKQVQSDIVTLHDSIKKINTIIKLCQS